LQDSFKSYDDAGGWVAVDAAAAAGLLSDAVESSCSESWQDVGSASGRSSSSSGGGEAAVAGGSAAATAAAGSGGGGGGGVSVAELKARLAYLEEQHKSYEDAGGWFS
jgi:hypothetical protein